MHLLQSGWVWTVVASLLLLGAVVVLCASPIVMQAHIARAQENDRITVTVRALFGLVRYKLDVPFIMLRGMKMELKEEQADQLPGNSQTNERLERFGLETVLRKLEQARQLLVYTDHLTSWMVQTLAHVCITTWRWKTIVGTGDACWTALATGGVWTTKSAVLGLLSQYARLQAEPQVEVEPLFATAYFATDWRCIAQIRLGYAIAAGLKLLLRIRKVKGGFTAWQNILFKA